MMRLKTRWEGLLVLLLLVPCSVRAKSAAGPMTHLKLLSARLPAGEGKILFYRHCVGCHGAELIQKRLQNRDHWILRYWEDLVFEMIDQWGASIGPDEAAPVARYLWQNFGSGAAPPSLENLLPEPRARQLVSQRCAGCHDAAIPLSTRRDLPQEIWRLILERMKGYGAPLADEEVSRLSRDFDRYLQSRSRNSGEPPLGALLAFLPADPRTDLIVSGCLSCHGPSEFQRRLADGALQDRHYWRSTLERMREKWEAPLGEEENLKLVDYFSLHFTR